MKQPITMIRGTTQPISIKVVCLDGSPYVLGEGEVLRFGVKKTPKDEECVIEKELTAENLEGEEYIIVLSPSDTEELDFGCYVYDVGLQTDDGYFNVIEYSEFDIKFNITGAKNNA